MRRLTALFCASMVMAGLLLVPLASVASAATLNGAGFPCDPHGTTAGSPTTNLSAANVDTSGSASLTCLFRATRLPSSFGGSCVYDSATVHVDFARRTVLAVNNNTYLLCSGGTVIAKTDLSITKDDGATSAIPGTATTYTIVVTNNGPTTAPNAVVSDPLPANATSATWSGSNGSSGTGALSDTITGLALSASVTYTMTVQVSPSATGSLANTATVAAGANTSDPNPANNSATDTDDLTPVADLAITKTDGKTDAVPGTATTSTITVTNNGPSTVSSLSLVDTVPDTLLNAAFGTPSTGTYDAASHVWSGLSLATGQSVSMTLTGTIDPAARGSLTNTATVSPPAGTTDPTPGNDSATDTDTLTPQVDVGVAVDDGVTEVVGGSGITIIWQFVIFNNGPSRATGLSVSYLLTLPSGSTFTDSISPPPLGPGEFGTWSATHLGGVRNVPGDLVITLSATSTETDTNPANNSATDTDTVVSPS